MAYQLENVREYMFRIVSQTTLSYEESSLSSGKAGKVRGGDRLPWTPVPGADNYKTLKQISWQVPVYGEPHQKLKAWCDQNNVPLHIFEWHADHRKVGLEQGAPYLLRPDTYVALADPEGSTATLDQYFTERGFRIFN